jgi:hypothetical protein
MLVAATELASRYPEDPAMALKTMPGLLYLSVNGATSLLSLWFLHSGQITLFTVNSLSPTLNEVLGAGVGGMVLLRSSIFTMRMGARDVSVGPAAILQSILAAVDRVCDKRVATKRTDQIIEFLDYKFQEIFAVPQPVINYEGYLIINVTRFNLMQSVIACVENDGCVAELERGGQFELSVQFTPHKPLTETPQLGIAKFISIRGGDTQPQTVSFRLFVDFGFVEIPPEERIIPVPAYRASTIERFPFLVPFVERETSVPPEISLRPEICVSVYQQTRYFDSCVLPVAVQ